MKRGKKNIVKDQLNRKYFLKYEIKKLILKSIVQNKNAEPILRGYAQFKKSLISRKSSISNQNNVCLIRGRIRGVWKFSQLSRHAMIKIATFGGLQNTKIKSW